MPATVQPVPPEAKAPPGSDVGIPDLVEDFPLATISCGTPGPLFARFVNTMFKLERVEISGFKSFYEKVDLAFPGSVTAVVGPNGCGKSNISDAVSWALGEQSAKTLRGERMDDVIFNGSSKRRPLGMAEVILTLSTRNA